MARVPEVPSCGVRWDRTFSLPLGVAPEDLNAAKRLEYVKALQVSGEVLNSTFTEYQTDPPASTVVRVTPVALDPKVILPRDTGVAASAEQALNSAAIGSVTIDHGFATAEFPAGTKSEEIEAKLAKSLMRDKTSRKFSRLAIPYTGLDAIQFYWIPLSTAGFAGVLGLSIPTVVPGDSFPAPAPQYLLQTQDAGADPVSQPLRLGEVDRLVLRAPVAGAFRFEPYYHYRFKAPNSIDVLGRSNSGRLVVWEPPLTSRERTLDKTETLVFRSRVFAFEHVNRSLVATMLHQTLMLHLGTFEQIVGNWQGKANADARFAVPKSSGEVYAWMVGSIKNILRSWVSFLRTLAKRPEDLAVAAAIPKIWSSQLTATVATKAEDQKCLAIVQQIAGKKDWLESITHFSETFYSLVLAGHSWVETLRRSGVDPAKRFPGVADAPPYSPRDGQSITAYERLRLLQDPTFQWVACFAGCPLGAPSALYAPAAAPAGSRSLPASALTTFEVEALHLAGQASQLLFNDASVAGKPGPTPSDAMDLTPYAAKQCGHCSTFQSEQLSDNPFHTTVDWLLELVRGAHRRQAEEGWLDLSTYMDDSTHDGGHPLIMALRFDEHLKAKSLRAQMDSLDALGVDADAQGWWTSKASRPGIGVLTPSRAFSDDRTRPGVASGSIVDFPTLKGTTPPRVGLDSFDLESAYLADSRLASPLPMAVVLALLKTEGVTDFSSVNRCTGFRSDSALRWESDPGGGLVGFRSPLNFKKVYDEAGSDLVGRFNWLRWPYGLDEFMVKVDFKAEAQKHDGESPSDYSARVLHDFIATAAASVWAGGSAHPDRDFNSKVKTRFSDTGVLAIGPKESLGSYIRRRVDSDFTPTSSVILEGVPQTVAPVHIWKKTQRVHWAIISLMVGWYSMRETDIRNGANGFVTPDAAHWLPPTSSPPDVTGKHPDSDEWRDFVSYYALVYLAYNTGPGPWSADVAAAAGAAAGTPLTPRNYLLFRYWPTSADAGVQAKLRLGIFNMVRFAIALDDYLRLDFQDGKMPKDYASATPDDMKVSAIAPPRWGL